VTGPATIAEREQELADSRTTLVGDRDAGYASLLAERDALREQLAGEAVDVSVGTHTKLFVTAVMGLSALAILSILVIFIVRPDRDNTALVATVVGFLLPLVTGFLAASFQQMHNAVNSRMTQLMVLVRAAAHAQGQLDAALPPRRLPSRSTDSHPDPIAVAITNLPLPVSTVEAPPA
jgi:hypothetical protein